ncbi:MAG: albusnodin/ikarugamycin family macrolactam cyclase [Haloechinothrix sp.]
MWWVSEVAAGESVRTGAGRVVLRAGATGPAVTVRSVEHESTSVTVLGHCPATVGELRSVARDVTAGSATAMTALPGSYAAVGETADGVALFAGDLIGHNRVFYGTGGDGRVVIASQAWRVATELGDRLNRTWLALRLLVPGAADVWQTDSPWERTAALRPGWVLRVGRDGSMRTSPAALLGNTSAGLDEAATRLRDALDLATRTRVQDAEHPSADLSGGLDSGTICALTAQHAPLDALTVTAPGVADADYAVALASVPGLRQHVVDEPDGVLPYTSLIDLPRLDEPSTCLAVLARERWWLNTIADRGSDLHLSGDGGDGVLTAPPAYLADLAAPATVRQLWLHARGWARLRHRAPSALIRAAFALRHTDYSTALRAATTCVGGRRAGAIGWEQLVSWLGPGGTIPWGSSEARELAAQALGEHAEHHSAPVAPDGLGIGDTVAWMALTAFAGSQRAYTELAVENGVNHHAPFLDNQVVRACWSVPAAVRTTPDQAKPLLLRAMRDIVPDVVLDRRDKGDYTAWHYRGLRANADALDDLLASARLGELGLIDIPAMRAELQRATAGLPIRLGAFDAVLSTELWLRAHQTPSPAPEVIDRATPIAA